MSWSLIPDYAGQHDPMMNLDDQAFIESFMPTVDLLLTKQLPRKLVITSLKKDYTFLLKGERPVRTKMPTKEEAEADANIR